VNPLEAPDVSDLRDELVAERSLEVLDYLLGVDKEVQTTARNRAAVHIAVRQRGRLRVLAIASRLVKVRCQFEGRAVCPGAWRARGSPELPDEGGNRYADDCTGFRRLGEPFASRLRG
jgi:hypothetical protein